MPLLGSKEELERIRYNARMREYKRRNREKVNEYKRKGYRKKLGLTEEQVEQNKKDRMAYARSCRQKKTQV